MHVTGRSTVLGLYSSYESYESHQSDPFPCSKGPRNNDAIRSRKAEARKALRALPVFRCDCDSCKADNPFAEAECPRFAEYAAKLLELRLTLSDARQEHKQALEHQGFAFPPEE